MNHIYKTFLFLFVASSLQASIPGKNPNEESHLVDKEPIFTNWLPNQCYNKELTRTCCPVSSGIAITWEDVRKPLVRGCFDRSLPKYEWREVCVGAIFCLTVGTPLCIASTTAGAAIDCLYCTVYGTPRSCLKACREAHQDVDESDMVSIGSQEESSCCRAFIERDYHAVCTMTVARWCTKIYQKDTPHS